MGLLSLPDEILDLAFKSLLPPFRSQLLAEIYALTVPVDLLLVRLVSRRLHRIATPLAWRRVQLRIASPSATNYIDSAAIIAATQFSSRSLLRCRFFHEHPDLAAHVRILLISLEWYAENVDLARDALRAATKAMSNLRTVIVWDMDVLAFKDIRQLFQKPLLRAICLMDLDGSVLPAHCDLGTGLKMLHVVNSMCPAALVAGAGPSLECVSIDLTRSYHGPKPVLTLREMPWKTLKEVALVDCVDEMEWSCFVDGFKLHKSLGLHTALTELVIGDLAGLDPVRFNQLLHSFTGHSLTRLTLYHVIALDPSTVSRIVKAFTVLSHLTLLTESELVPWPGALDAYAQAIAGLPLLECLTWNNFSLDPALDTAFSSLSNGTLGTLYSQHVHALVRHVHHLRYVKFISVTDCMVDTVYVKRAYTGSTGPVEVRRLMEAALHTSSWATTSDVFQDI